MWTPTPPRLKTNGAREQDISSILNQPTLRRSKNKPKPSAPAIVGAPMQGQAQGEG